MHVKFTCVRTEKLRDSANQPLLSRGRRKTQSNTKRERRAQWARPTKGKVTSYRVFRLVILCCLIFSLLSTWLPRSIPAFVCLFVCFFWARPRGTLIAAAIIITTRKLRINLSFLAPTLCQSSVQIFCTANYACRSTTRSSVHTKPVNPIIEIATFWNRYPAGANLTKLLQV